MPSASGPPKNYDLEALQEQGLLVGPGASGPLGKHEFSVRAKAQVLAASWLEERLAAGPVESAILKAEADATGLGTKALRMARQRLGLVVKRSGKGKTMRSTWSLPSAAVGAGGERPKPATVPALPVPPYKAQAPVPASDPLTAGEITWRDRRIAYFRTKGIDEGSASHVATILVVRDRQSLIDPAAQYRGSCAECQCLEGDSCEPGRNGHARGPKPLTEVWLCQCARRPI